MKIRRTFKEDGVSLEMLIGMVLDKNLDAVIDNELFDSYEEGTIGGKNDDKTTNL